MIKLNEFELKIKDKLSLTDKDCLKMNRALEDISQINGMGKIDILEFMEFGAKEELEDLEENYDWNRFQRKILYKLSAK